MVDTTKSPYFTVVLNTYNRAGVVSRAIADVLDQRCSDFELVVVDDGSTDDTGQVIARHTDPRVRSVWRRNGGLAAARNTGLEHARGRFVAFMDDDDEVAAGWLTELHAATVGGDVGAATCGTVIRTPGRTDVERLPGPMGPAFDDHVGLFLPGTFVVRRDVLLAVGGYVEELRCSEQTELALRVSAYCTEHGLRLASVGLPLVITNREADARRPLRRADYLHDGALLVLARHGSRLRRDPELYANFKAIAAVQGARMGEYREARGLLAEAIAADPTEVRHLLRLVVAATPGLRGRVWSRWEPRSAPIPATAPRREQAWRRIARALPGASRLRRRWRTSPPWPPRRIPVAPPPIGVGWTVKPPDFVGVGAQRAGTSWWHDLVIAHPDVHVNPGVPKEVHYFDRFEDAPWTAQREAEYPRLFPRPPGKITGEWTPEYMLWPWCPPLLAAAGVPRLIVMLRDPVERFWSGWSFSTRRGAPAVSTIAGDAFHRGLYARQLEWLLEHFDRDQILLLQYERCLAEPRPELRRTYRFLGLDEDFVPPAIDARVRPAYVQVPLPEPLRRSLTSAYRDDVTRLFERFSELRPELWPNFAPGTRGDDGS